MKTFPATIIAIVALGAAACSGEPEAQPDTLPKYDASLVEASSDGAHDAFHEANVDAPDATPYSGPTHLSETGLYSDFVTRTLAPGVRTYDVRYPLWADGADKQRYLALPSGTTIDTSLMDVWKFPIGTKAWKEFRKDGKLIETRLLWKQAEGAQGWLKVAFVWNADGSDAVAAPDGVTNALGTTHDVPNIDACEQCHNGVGDVLAGVGAVQLSKENGGGYLSTLIQNGMLSDPPAAEFPVPGDGVIEDALGYLHGNCGHCHNNHSYLAQKRALRLKLLVGITTPEETPAYTTTIYKKMNHLLGQTILAVVPGDPAKSQLWFRMSFRDVESMPPFGTEVVDDVGVATIGNWIQGLPQGDAGAVDGG